MPYCDITDVVARNPVRGAFTASTKPTASQVGLFIDDAAGIVDSVLVQAGYSTPVVVSQAATSVRFTLRNANAVGAWYFTEWAAPNSDRRSEAEDMWESAKKMLLKVELDLPKNAATELPRQGSIATPYFSRDMCL